MIPRYEAPRASVLFSEEARLGYMASATRLYAQRRTDDPDTSMVIAGIPTPPLATVKTIEARTGHEVVAFLEAFIARTPTRLVPLIHVGLTSSDLTEYAQQRAIYEHAAQMILANEVFLKMDELNYPRAGRTHGQRAQVTSWRHQFDVWRTSLHSISEDLEAWVGRSGVVKSPGPTGLTPFVQDPPGMVPSTQILPRDYLLSWAALYLRLAVHMENLALTIRLGARAEVGEFQEGAADDRVGSSAMPHKKNPIDSEKVTGLARLARGNFLAIAETAGALWEDRDLSNSSTERVAVADLAHLVEYMIDTMTRVMANLKVSHTRMAYNAQHPEVWYSVYQTVLQMEAKISVIAASDTVRMVSTKHWGSFPLARIDMQMRIGERHGEEVAKTVDQVVVAYFESTFNPKTWV